jgi:hypothetical protein
MQEYDVGGKAGGHLNWKLNWIFWENNNVMCFNVLVSVADSLTHSIMTSE